ncbi:MAG: hypothetical protein KW793_04570 [Candidatus Doudnabacteria bacterium]|nr:hypothetical protein [Candidatus Doudnabacteria bacterium]
MSTAAVLERRKIRQNLSPAEAALNRLEIEPFPAEAVREYMADVELKARNSASWLAQKFAKSSELLYMASHWTLVIGIFTAVCAVGISLTQGPSPALNYFLLSVPLCLSSFILHKKAAEAQGLTWGLRSPADSDPETAKRMIDSLQRMLKTQVEFQVYELGMDPFLQMVYYDFESGRHEAYFIYGWDGGRELIPLGGKILVAPKLK